MTARLMTSSVVRLTRTASPHSPRRVSDLFSMKTTAMRRPTLSFVRSAMIPAPRPSSVMNTAGVPLCCSMPEAALVM